MEAPTHFPKARVFLKTGGKIDFHATLRSGIRNEFRPQTSRPHPSLPKFFQNSATPFHALLGFFLILTFALPAFAQVPAKVALSRAHTPVADGFTVAWTDLTNETAYHLEHATSANFTSSTLLTNISANATSHALTGLTPNTTYYVRVRGAAAGGNGTWSDVQSNQLLSLDPGQTRYLSVAGVPHGASHSVNFTISDVFGSANAAGLASGPNATSSTVVMLMGANGSTEHSIFYNSSENQWREGPTNKGSQVVGLGKGFMVKNNTGNADIFLLSGSIPLVDQIAVTVFPADAPTGRLSLVAPSKTTPTSLRFLGLTSSNNTTTGLKRATTAKDADMLLVPDGTGNLKRYHFDGTNWRSGLRTVADPTAVNIPAGGAFFVRRAAGSNFTQWRPPSEYATDGLVLHFDAGNTSSYPGNGTTWTDLSGNGYTGNLTNGPTFSSSGGGRIVFDGTNDFVTGFSEVSLNTGAPFTVEFWFNLTAFSDNFPTLLQIKTNTTQGWNLTLSRQSNYTGVVFGSFSSWGRFKTDTIPTTGIWNHLVVTYNGAGAETAANYNVYLNNILQTLSNAGGFNQTTQVNYIGTTNAATRGVDDFNGGISLARIYNRALSPAEIHNNYSASKGRYEVVTDGLVLHLDAGNAASYPGNGTAWRDLSASSNNGTLTNGPTYGSANGGRISFDGSDDYIQLNSLWEWSIGSTVNVWIDLSKSSGDAKYFLGRINTSNMGIRYNVNTQSFLIFDGLMSNIQTISYPKPTGFILFSAIRLNSNEYEYFVNGESIGIGTVSTSNTTISLTTIGRRTDGLNSDASIATVMFYNRRLSLSELQQNYNSLKRRFEDADAAAHLNAVEAADGQALETGVREAVDKFVKGCKADGIWTAIKASCILAGARTLNGTLVPLVGTAPTNFNFVQADYDRKNGLKSNGSKYLDSNRSNNSDPQDNKHYSVHIHTLHSGGTAGTYIGSSTLTSGATNVLRSGVNPDNLLFRLNENNVNSLAAGNSTGFIGASRSNASNYIARYGGSNSTITRTSETPDNSKILVFSGGSYSNNGRLQFYSIGESLNLALLNSRLTTLMSDLAAAIP